MNAKVTVLPKRDLNHIYTEASINRRLVKKGWNFSGPQCKRKPREDTTYLLFSVGSFVVRFSMLMTSFQSVFWSVFVFPSRIFSSLDIRLFTYAFSCSISRSSHRILLILAFFPTFLRVLLDSLHAFYFLLSLAALSLSFQAIFTQNPLSTNLNYYNFLQLRKLQFCWYSCFAS